MTAVPPRPDESRRPNPPAATGDLHRRLLRAKHFLVESDHLSYVNKYLPWRYPLGSLIMTASAALLCGWFVHVHAYTMVIGVGAVVVLGLFWPWLSLGGIRGQLSFESSRTVEGRAVQARLSVTNYWPVGAWGLRLYAGDHESVINLAVVPGWRTTEFTFPFVPPVRGEYPRGRATLATGFPFGLREARRALATEGTLIAWPRAFPLGAIPEAAASDRTREGLVFQNRAGHSGEFFGVRPYVRGDSLRRIHWPQTARHGELIICERQASANVRLQLVLDADTSVHRGRGPESSREWAIRTAASLIDTFVASGALAEMVVGTQEVPPGSGVHHRQRLLDALARIPERGICPLTQVLCSPRVRGFTSGLQLVITTDRGLSGIEPSLLHRRPGHVILLRAAAWDASGPREPPSLPRRRAWIEIDTNVDVPAAFQRSWREVLHAN